MICPVCKGYGALITATKGHGLEWWECAPCGGSGVRIQYGPAVYLPERIRAALKPGKGQ